MLSRPEGSFLFLIAIVYTSHSIYQARKEFNKNASDDRPFQGHRSMGKTCLDLIIAIAGLILLGGGAKLFVSGAVSLARMLHINEAVIGLTIVAVGTSLPELATSAVASFRREGDIAIGNVIGSNIFNILAILGITSIISPLAMKDINIIDTSTMIITAVLLLPLSWSGAVIKRWEGALLLGIYAGYIFYLFYGI